MSHSKYTRRGHSWYIEKLHRDAVKYINTCKVCGFRGYSPVLESEDCEEWRVIRQELMQMFPRLELDALGRCAQCAAIMDQQSPAQEVQHGKIHPLREIKQEGKA